MDLVFEADIAATPDRVFGMLADLRDYGWLPKSPVFRGTSAISAGPIGLGTTYVESGPLGIRRGAITAFDAPTRLAFDQPMTLRPPAAGVVDVQVTIALTPTATGTHLRREVRLGFAGPVRFARALVARSIVAENHRVLAALTAHAEG